VVADALSRNALARAEVSMHTCELYEQGRDLNMSITEIGEGIMLQKLEISFNLRSRVVQPQCLDVNLQRRIGHPEFSMASDGVILFEGRICVADDSELKRLILEEAHKSHFTIHPSATKMYQDLKKDYWWPRMKTEIAEFVARCIVCQQVKIEHQRPAGLLEPLEIP